MGEVNSTSKMFVKMGHFIKDSSQVVSETYQKEPVYLDALPKPTLTPSNEMGHMISNILNSPNSKKLSPLD
ncbi:MAG: hypothetical protein H0U75_01355 [Legionella sp.]|nr:hypothetical protein [Legionella sp.]